WELFVPYFTTALRGYGLDQEVVVCGFDRELTLWAGEDDDFEANPPRAVVVFPEARDLFRRNLAGAGPAAGVRPEAARFLLRAVSSLSGRHPGTTWILSTAEVAFPGALAGVNDSALNPLSVATDAFNDDLRRRCRETVGWSLFERERVTRAL